MEVRASQIAALLGGDLVGEDLLIKGLCTLDCPQPNRMGFINRDSAALFEQVGDQLESLFLIPTDSEQPFKPPHIRTPNPRGAFARATSLFATKPEPGISPLAFVHPTATVDPTASIAHGASIGALCVIGPETEVRPNAVIGPRVQTGRGCVIHSGATVGGEGFGIDTDENGNNIRLPHLGGVILGDFVEVGCQATVCAGTIDPTVVENYSKIDDHVHVAHNVLMGPNCVITAHAEISGSVKMGAGVWLGPNASILEGIRVGADTMLGIGAVAIRDLEPNSVYVGSPARRIRARYESPPNAKDGGDQ
ncbi:transferase [Caulobacter soli]|uniref:transferase n=1 Tax=Caulobacter soli TaxID=2708539 RepID=UPI0013E9F97F|nr:transferase [Caulobacter soli]